MIYRDYVLITPFATFVANRTREVRLLDAPSDMSFMALLELLFHYND